MEKKPLELWALVELFGHQRMAGKVIERTIGSDSFIQIDVPENDKVPAFSRFLNPKAIYAINPVDENTARTLADSIKAAPIARYSVEDAYMKMQKLLADSKDEEAGSDDDDLIF